MSSTYKVDNINSITNLSDLNDPSKKISFDLSNISVETTRTITVPDLNITLAGTNSIQALTNKTINALNNTITNISNTNIKSNAGIDATKIADGTVNNTKFQYINDLSSKAVGITDSQTLTNKYLTDSFIYFQNNGDLTKKFQFDLSEVTSGTTRTITVPDSNLVLLGTSLSQTVTNKTIDALQNTITNITNNNIKNNAAIDASKIANGSVSNSSYQYLSGVTSNIQTQINNHTSSTSTHGVSGTIVGTSDSQVLTNKTLTDTSNNFQNNNDNTKKFKFSAANISNSTTRTITVPDFDLTLVGLNNNQIMTNKIINADNNTLTNISDSNININAAINASKIANGSVSNTEYQYLDGLTDNIQTQINTHTSDTNNPHGVNKTQIGLSNVQNIKVNLNAIIDPIDSDDNDSGYTIGSRWINTINNKEFVCVDNTIGSAIWKNITLPSFYDAIVDINGNGDYVSLYDAFNAGHKTVFIKKGTYTEINNIIIPSQGIIIGESTTDTIINLSGSVSIRCDGNNGIKETTGSISFTTNSLTVNGSGTSFTNLNPNDYILIGQSFIEIESITNDTTLILKDAYRGQTQTNQPYIAQHTKYGITIKNITISNSSSTGLFIRALRHSIFDSIEIKNCIANIEIYDSASNSFSNIVSYNSSNYGLKINNCYSNSLYGCKIYNSNNHGIQFSGITENIVVNDMISNNNKGNGINFMDVCSSISVNNSLFVNNDGLGINTEPTTKSIIINSCTINGNGNHGIDFDGINNMVSNCVIKCNVLYGIQAGDSGIISNNFIDNNGSNGINMDGDEKSVVTNNRITNNTGHGIWANDDWIIISDNYIEGNTGDGIKLVESNDCVIGNNIISNNGTYGINLSGAPRSIISGNKVIYHTIGIFITGISHDCSIGNNIVTLASSHGIKITSNTNSIYGNICRDNSGGGLYIEAGATNNNIMINDFTGNTDSNILDNGTVNSSLPPILINNIDSRSETSLLIGKNSATKIELGKTGITTEIKGKLDVLEGIDITGNITVTGTVDGRNISIDGSDLDSHLLASSGIHGINGTVVGTTDSQTITNKAINADLNTITNISNNSIKSNAAIDATKIADGSISNTEYKYLNGLSSNVQTQINNHLADISAHGTTSSIVGISDQQTITNKIWGDSLNMNNNKITNLLMPTEISDAATKGYVDSVVTGLDFKESVKVASTIDLNSNSSISGTITYNSVGGESERGQITATLVTSNVFTIDDIVFTSSNNGSRILLKNQDYGDQNGIWITNVSGLNLILDRATDFDQDDKVTSGAFVFVEEGTVNDNSGYVLSTNNPITIGGISGTSLAFTQFSGNGQIIAGNGLTKTGDTINVVGSNTIIANSDNLEVNSTNIANQVLLSSGTVNQTAIFGALPLNNSNAVSGKLPINKGGTNTTSFSDGSRIIATNSSNTALESTSIDPLLLVTLSGSNILTNKTIDATNNTITNIGDMNLTNGINVNKLADGSVTNTKFQYINSLSSNAQTQLDSKVNLSNNQTISGQKTFSNNTAIGSIASIDNNSTLLIDDEITNGGNLKGIDIITRSKCVTSGIYNVVGLSGYNTVENTNYNAGSSIYGVNYGIYGIGTSGQFANLDITGINLGIYMNDGSTLSANKVCGANIFLGRDLSDTISTSGTMNVTDAYVLKLDNGTNGLIATNHYGLYIEEINRGTSSYTIYTTGGNHHLGGNLDITGNITISGTVDGREINADGLNMDNHIAETSAHGVSGNIVGTLSEQTLSNKTIDSTVNTLLISADDIISGTLSNSRISISNVTQHESSINHDNLLGYNINKHIDHSQISITAGIGLSGGGTIDSNRTINIDINGLTIDNSPDGTSDYVITYDSSSATHKKVLLNNLPSGSGGSGGSGTSSLTTYEVTGINDVTTTSTSYTLLNNMTITPPSGTYIVSFSSSGNNSSGNGDSIYAIFSGGTIISHSERYLAWNGGGQSGGFDSGMHTQAEVTVNGSQTIEVKYATAGGNFNVHKRSMHLIKK